ncbi:MAG: hypothetical protein Q9165_001210 [Trypethelium subeluteriae]
MAGFDVAAGAFGIASFGIQTCQGLLSYYQDVKDYNIDIGNTYDAIADLAKTLSLLKATLEREDLDEERSDRVRTCIRSCEEGLIKLSEKLQKLKICGTAEGIRQKILSNVQRMWYPFRAETLAKLRENVEDIQGRLGLALQVLQLDTSATIEASVVQISVQMQSLLATQDSEHSRKMVDWLSPPDPHVWICGKAGCGKTVLCSTAIVDVQSHCQTKANTGCAIFYFSFSDDRKQTYENLLRSLVEQLSWKEPGQSMLRQAYDKRNQGVDELQKILRSSIDAYDTFFLIIDALDESPEGSDIRQTVLGQVDKLAQSAPNLKILATSREVRDIREAMEKLEAEQVVVTARAMNVDIQRFVSSEISNDRRLQRFKPESKAAIKETISQKADGIVDSDNRGDSEDTLNILSGLVTIARNSNDTEASDGIEVSDDGTHNYQPPKPDTKVQLAHFSVKEFLESGRMPEKQAKVFHLEPALGHRFLTQSCLKYIMHYSSSDKTLSTQDLETFPLLRYAAKSWYYHSALQQCGEASLEASFLSSQKVLRDWLHVHEPDILWKDSFQHPWSTGSSLYYASFCGLSVVVAMLIEQGEPIDMQGGEWGNALQAASRQGYIEIVKLLLDRGADVNAQGNYSNALQAASGGGYIEIVKLLLDRGADVNAQEGYHGNALKAASRQGYTETVKLLLDRVADVNAQKG